MFPQPEQFAINFDPTTLTNGVLGAISSLAVQSATVYAVQHKLNAYPTGGFFKAHRESVDCSPTLSIELTLQSCSTPRGEDHLGTLMFCLPTTFTGGELVVRSKAAQQITFDWAAASLEGTISWGFLYADCDHEVLPVLSGTRITISYDVFRNPSRACALTPSLSSSNSDVDEEEESTHQISADSDDKTSEGDGESDFESECPSSFGSSDTINLSTDPTYVFLKEMVFSETFLPEGGILAIGLQHEIGRAHV